jgi:FAD:protein FMN transferase
VFIAHLERSRKHLSVDLLAVGLLAGIILLGCTPNTQIYQRSQLLMGTTVDITVVSTDESKAHDAITAAFGEIGRIEALLSTYQENSDLSKVNQAAGSRPVTVNPEVMAVVKEAFRIAHLTEGAFNIALGPAISLWDVTGKNHIPEATELEKLLPLLKFSDIELDEARRTIFLPHSGMRIDVGGIGKGYAADQAEQVLKRYGMTSGIIAIAGDVKVFGHKSDGGFWHIGIRHPRRNDPPLAEIDLIDEAISTSGDYERFFIKDGQRYHHILNPKTLFPAGRSQSVTVIAKKAILTDALATGVFVMGPEKGMALIERLPDIEGVIVDAQGKVEVSSGLKSRLKLHHSTG